MDLSDAIKEAYEYAPTDQIYYDTLEIDHTEFAQPLRIVNSYTELTTNDGTFVPVQFSCKLPETAGSTRGQMIITVNGLPNSLRAAIRNSTSSTSPATIKYRQYLDGELDADAELPVTLSVASIQETFNGIEITALFPDLIGAYFPRYLMTTTNLPGLRT